MVDVLVEEPSAAAALRVLIPLLMPGWSEDTDFAIRVFSGKSDLLKRLPNRLQAYRKWPRGPKVLVLVDRDAQDCMVLKAELEGHARTAGLATKSAPLGGAFRVVNRLAVEELEAWFLGDPTAVRAAYPKVAPTFEKRTGLRDSDNVQGGTAEALERLLKKAGYYQSMPKVEVASAIAAHMDPARNTSSSFSAFREGLTALASV